MSAKPKKAAHAGAENLTTFDVQVCSSDGRLLSEYSLTRHDHDVSTLVAAESCACGNLPGNREESVVVIVSELTLTKLRQVQTDCQSGKKQS